MYRSNSKLLRKRKIPHIAIKLDQRIPYRNCEIWGQGLGLPNSIAYSLHCVSRNENAVIILDQLDALRWTQTNSSEAACGLHGINQTGRKLKL